MKNELAVGILFFVALAILGYFTIIMTGNIFGGRHYYKMTVIFPNTEGLDKSAKVKVNGVICGTIETIKLMADNQVFVTCKMFEKFTLYENYRIKIKNETTLGGKYASIYPGTSFANDKYYSIVATRNNLKGEGAVDMFEELSNLVAENRENIYKTFRNIREITSKINTGQGTIGKLVNENKVYKDADELVKDLRETIEDAREQAPITSFIRAALSAF